MLNNKIIKDPTKYWYIEKYVYGVLKETVEVALGSGTTFGSIDSGVSGDTFYGWSINSTSTKSTFNATTTYKNTVANVKNNLDAENTLKIYAIYRWTGQVISTANISPSKPFSNSTSTTTVTVAEDSTAIFGGYRQCIKSTTSSSGGSGNTTYSAAGLYGNVKINGEATVGGGVNTSPTTGGGHTVSVSVNKGDIIWIQNRDTTEQTTSGGTTNTTSYYDYIYCRVPHYVTTTIYRVEL